MRKPYCDINDPRLQWLEEDFPLYLSTWKENVMSRPLEGDVDRKKMLLTPETEEGLLVACFSMSSMIKTALNAGAKYVLARRINQDPLESYFGHQRQRGRRHDAPTVGDFASNSKSLDILKHSNVTGSNVEVEAH